MSNLNNPKPDRVDPNPILPTPKRKYYLIRDIVQRGDVKVTQIASQQNLTNPFTKAIPGKLFNLHLESMGMREMPNML